MHTKALRKKLHQRVAKLEKDYRNIGLAFNEEEVHAFRVDYKKSRSLIRLLNAGKKDQKKISIKKKWKRFYQATGNIRNNQLIKTIILKVCYTHNLIPPHNLLARLHNRNCTFVQNGWLGMQQINNQQAKVITHVHRKTVHRCAAKFIPEELGLLKKLFFFINTRDEELHAIRKIIKDLLYVHRYLPAPLLLSIKKLMKTIKRTQLEEKLGNYHDLDITLAYLTTIFNSVMDYHCNRVMIKIYGELEKEKERQNKEIMVLLEQLRIKLA